MVRMETTETNATYGPLQRRLSRPMLVLVSYCAVLIGAVSAARAAISDHDGTWTADIQCDRPTSFTGTSYQFSFSVDVRSGKLTGRNVLRNPQGYEDTSEWQGTIEGDRVKLSGEAKRAIQGNRWQYDLVGKFVADGKVQLDGSESGWWGSNFRKNRDCRLTLVAARSAPGSSVPGTVAGPAVPGRNATEARTAAPRPAGVIVPYPEEPRRATTAPRAGAAVPTAPAVPSTAPAPSRPAAARAAAAETELDRAGTALERALAARRGTGTNGPGAGDAKPVP